MGFFDLTGELSALEAKVRADSIALHLAIIDSSNDLRTDLATKQALLDTASALRTDLATKQALVDTASTLRTDLATRQALLDTALALRTDLATKQSLLDTATALRTDMATKQSLLDTASALRSDLATKQALLDTASSLRTDLASKQALQDTAADLRNDLASKLALSDSIGAVRTALLDTAQAIRDYIDNLPTAGLDSVLAAGNDAADQTITNLGELRVGTDSSYGNAVTIVDSNSATSGYENGLIVRSLGTNTAAVTQSAVYGEINGTNGENIGVDGTSQGTSSGTNTGAGGYARNGDFNRGVHAVADSGRIVRGLEAQATKGKSQNVGVFSTATGGDTLNVGVIGQATNGGSTNSGVLGIASGGSGINNGVEGRVIDNSNATGNRAVFGYNQSNGGFNEGVSGFSVGVNATQNTGLYGQAQSSTGTNRGAQGVAVFPTTGSNIGVEGIGRFGNAQSIGLYGAAQGNSSTFLVYGVFGQADSNGTIKRGVVGNLEGASDNNDAAVYGIANGEGTNTALYGRANNVNNGTTDTNIALVGVAQNAAVNIAGWFQNGNVLIDDTLFLANGVTQNYVLTATGNDGRAEWRPAQSDPDSDTTNELITSFTLTNDSLTILEGGMQQVVLFSGFVDTAEFNNYKTNALNLHQTDSARLDSAFTALIDLQTRLTNDSIRLNGLQTDIDNRLSADSIRLDSTTTALDIRIVNDSIRLNFTNELLGDTAQYLQDSIDAVVGNLNAHVLVDADTDTLNEIQLLSISNDTIFLSNGGFAVLPAAAINNDNDSTNEIINLAILNGGDSLLIVEGEDTAYAELFALNQSADVIGLDTRVVNDSTRLVTLTDDVNAGAYKDSSSTNELIDTTFFANDTAYIVESGDTNTIDLKSLNGSASLKNTQDSLAAAYDSLFVLNNRINDTASSIRNDLAPKTKNGVTVINDTLQLGGTTQTDVTIGIGDAKTFVIEGGKEPDLGHISIATDTASGSNAILNLTSEDIEIVAVQQNGDGGNLSVQTEGDADFAVDGNLNLNADTVILDPNDALRIPTGAADGKILTSDADGNATWEDAPASYTTKGIDSVLAAGSNAAGDSITNLGAIGVGTNNLLSPLTIAPSTNSGFLENGILLNNDNTGSTENAIISARTNNGGGSPAFSLDINSIGGFSMAMKQADSNLHFFGSPDPNSTEIMTLTKDRNVGIGKTAPLRRLEIAGDLLSDSLFTNLGHIDSLRIANAYSFPTNDGDNGDVLTTDGLGNATWQPAGATYTTKGIDSVLAVGSDANNDSLYNLRMLGIGTSAPTASLDIQTSDEFSLSIINNGSSTNDKKGVFSTLSGTGSGDNFGLYGGASNSSGINYGVYGEATGTQGTKYGVYGTTTGSNAWAGYFNQGNVYINDNLGIGVLNPARRLEVLGDLSTDSLFTDSLYATLARIEIMQASNLSIENTSSSAVMRLKGTSDGFVYSGLILESMDNPKFWEITNRADSTGRNGLLFQQYTGSFYTQRMYIDSIGRVGINTTKPEYTLDVNGFMRAYKLTIDTVYSLPTVDGDNGDVLTTDGLGNVTWQPAASVSLGDTTQIADADNDTKIMTEKNANEDQIRFDIAGTERAVLDSTGLEIVSTLNGSSAQEGMRNTMQSGNGTKVGIYNDIHQSSGTAGIRGIYNDFDVTTNSVITAIHNRDAGTAGNGRKYGLLNQYTGGTGEKYGVQNILTQSSGSNTIIGSRNNITHNGTGVSYSILNDNQSTGSGLQYGIQNLLVNGGTGQKVGIYNAVKSPQSGGTVIYGVQNVITDSSASASYGFYNSSQGSSSLKYGFYSTGEDRNYLSSKLGIGTSSPDSALTVVGGINTENIRISNGAGVGRVLTSDANGKATWQTPVSSSDTLALIKDADGNTYITTELLANEDKIRFFRAGNNAVTIDEFNSTNRLRVSGYASIGRMLLTDTIRGSATSNVVFKNSAIPSGNGSYRLGSATNRWNNVYTDTIQIANGRGVGKVLTSDADGNATWQVAAGGGDTTQIADVDNDTKVSVSSTNNNIDFIQQDTTFWRMNSATLEALNTGNSLFIGENAGENDDRTNNANIFIGREVGQATTNGATNVGIGDQVLKNNTGFANTAMGYLALTTNDTGKSNVALGWRTMEFNDGGSFNTAVGHNAANKNTFGKQNAAFGNWALNSNTTGDYNTAIGSNSLQKNISGTENVALGYHAYYNGTSGSRNTMLGSYSGENASGSDNVFLGYQAGFNETGSNKLYIANSSTPTPLIYGEFDNDSLRFGGAVRIADELFVDSANATQGYVLTADANGAAKWQAGSSASPWSKSVDTIYSDTNWIGIGTTNPDARMSIIQSDGDYAFEAVVERNTSDPIIGIFGGASGTGTGQKYGAYFSSIYSGGSQNIGAFAEVDSASTNNIGFYGLGYTQSGTEARGVQGQAFGTGTNIGLFGKATGGSINYAAYFDTGYVFITDTMIIPADAAAGKVLTSDASGYATWQLPSISATYWDTTTTTGKEGRLIHEERGVYIGGEETTVGPFLGGGALNVTSADSSISMSVEQTGTGSSTYAAYFGNFNSNSSGSALKIGVRAAATGTGGGTNIGLDGRANGGTTNTAGRFVVNDNSGTTNIGTEITVANGNTSIGLLSTATGAGTDSVISIYANATGGANPYAAIFGTGRVQINDTLQLTRGAGLNKILTSDADGKAIWKSIQEINTCPTGMVAVNGSYCIDADERTAAIWFVADSICVDDGYTLATYSEWYGAATQEVVSSIGFNNAEDADWEWTANFSQNNAMVVGNNTAGSPARRQRAFRDPEVDTAVYRCVKKL